MTEREEEILSYIKSNPMISQQALADILGIERSSVAVHISNLTKKGIIKGKGYIMEAENYILVIGGSNMDLLGTPCGPLIMEDSNPGRITTSPGGVARNISENLAHLQVETKLLSAVGKDLFGEQLIEETSKAGVDTHYIKRLSSLPTSIYMSILDENKNMKVALSHMDISHAINIPYIKEHQELIKNASYIIIDTNLSQDVIDYLFMYFTDSLFIVDPVSVTKSIKIKDHLPGIFCLKANEQEAAMIIGKEFHNEESLMEGLKLLHTKGVKHPIISLGDKGLLYMEEDEVVHLSPEALVVVNANGAGDAFTAGITYGFFNQLDYKEAILCGQKAAGAALKTKDTVNKNLSVNDLL